MLGALVAAVLTPQTSAGLKRLLCCASALHPHPLLPCTPQSCAGVQSTKTVACRMMTVPCGKWEVGCGKREELADVLAAGVHSRMTCALQSTKSVASTAQGHTRKDRRTSLIDARLSRAPLTHASQSDKDRRTPRTHASQSDGSLASVREEGAPKLVMLLSDAVPHAPMLLSDATPCSSP